MSTLLEIPVWGTKVVFLVNETEEDLKEFIKNNRRRITKNDEKELFEAFNNDEIDGQVNAFEKGDYYCMIKSPYNAPCWSHEIFHVVNRILTDRGVTHDGSAEPWAYLIGYVTKIYLKEVLPAVREEQKERNLKKKSDNAVK